MMALPKRDGVPALFGGRTTDSCYALSRGDGERHAGAARRTGETSGQDRSSGSPLRVRLRLRPQVPSGAPEARRGKDRDAAALSPGGAGTDVRGARTRTLEPARCPAT